MRVPSARATRIGLQRRHRRLPTTSRAVSLAGIRSLGGLRRGFTLLEVLVVVTLIVILASMTFPSLMRYVRERQMREQAHAVRIQIAGARSKAIDYGLTYQFRYEPGGRKFVVLPHDRPDVGSGEQTSGGTLTTSSAATLPRVQIVSGELAEPCRFEAPNSLDPRTRSDQPVYTERLPEEWLALIPNATGLRETVWSPAIRFFADGVADDGRLAIIDDDQRRIEVTVRGLTGTVQAGSLTQERTP